MISLSGNQSTDMVLELIRCLQSHTNFLDIGTKMGQYHLEELLPRKGDKNNILHPRHTGSGIPPVNTFHSVVQNRAGSQHANIEQWCVESAMVRLFSSI